MELSNGITLSGLVLKDISWSKTPIYMFLGLFDHFSHPSQVHRTFFESALKRLGVVENPYIHVLGLSDYFRALFFNSIVSDPTKTNYGGTLVGLLYLF